MSEYLKREDVRRAVLHNEGDAVIAAIDELPVTELPEKRAAWDALVIIDDNDHILLEGFMCNRCGAKVTFEWEYCPNCGARMRKVDEHDD